MTNSVTNRPPNRSRRVGFEYESDLSALRLRTASPPTEADLATIRAYVAEVELLKLAGSILPTTEAVLDLALRFLDTYERPPWVGGEI